MRFPTEQSVVLAAALFALPAIAAPMPNFPEAPAGTVAARGLAKDLSFAGNLLGHADEGLHNIFGDIKNAATTTPSSWNSGQAPAGATGQ